MSVSGDVNDYYLKFKMLNPACLGSAGTILETVQSDPGEVAKYFLTGGLCRHGTLDVSYFAQRLELIEKIKNNRGPFSRVRLDTVYANGTAALAITSKSLRDDYIRLVLYLSKGGERWLVTDVQIEKKGEYGEALRDFLEEYPDAKAIRVDSTADTTTKRM